MHIRPLRPDDLPTLLSWAADPELSRTVADTHVDRGRPSFPFVIESEGRVIGTVALFNVSHDAKEAEIGVCIAEPSLRGSGVGLWCADQLMRQAFAGPTERIRAHAERGSPMAGLLPRLGFVHEHGAWVIDRATYQRKWGHRHGMDRAGR